MGATDASQIASLSTEQKIDIILKNQESEAKRRKFVLTMSIAGLVFAAARLGIIAIPLVKAARARPKG